LASTRRHGRDPNNDDVSIYLNSLNRHLACLRVTKALDGPPYFSLHLGSQRNNEPPRHQDSPVASSLVLARTLPADENEAAPTTRKFNLPSQRMGMKSTAMTAWSDAVLDAYLKANGSMPVSSETGAALSPRVHE
jgi:hypothetical protein